MTALPPPIWKRLSTLLDEVLELPAVDREAALRRAGEGDAELRPHLERLLAAGGELASLLGADRDATTRQRLHVLLTSEPEPPPPGPAAGDPAEQTTWSLIAPTESGQSIGPYRLLEKLGEGGMGEVWLAEQTVPIRRQVALKLIKAGMDSRQVIARFEAERQALALMDHPAIARVFDAGQTSRGLPYFVMEHVKGEPITAYCDRQRLSIHQRLDLFVQVCDGVQHAHHKGIIHRDLKPSNILVGLQADRAVPKIIDFGVAKATAIRLTDSTMHTLLGTLVGTPEYMSPEQAELTGVDIDTRTDVYALGVMLYELLSGVLPFDFRELRSGSYDDMRRKIREEEPARPSTKVRQLGERGPRVASRRQTEPARLVSRLRGDLDWIVMKALAKDRTRRYGSPAELAADIGRHLDNQPVLAGPPAASYRLGKFIRRHRVGVSVAAASILGLLAFAATTSLQARRIAAERDRANQEAEVSRRVSDFMTGMFEVSDPGEARGSTVTAREILDKAAQKIDAELKDSPEIQARLMVSMGQVYRKLGLFEPAETLLKRATEIQSALLGPEHPDTLVTLQWLGWVAYERGRMSDAETVLRHVLETQSRVVGRENAGTARTMASLAVVYDSQGRKEEAGALREEALAIRRKVLGPDDPETIHSIGSLAASYEAQGRLQEAEALGRDVLETTRRRRGSEHPETLGALSSLSDIEWRLKRYDQSEALIREALAAGVKVLGNDHPQVLLMKQRLANILADRGKLEDATTIDREILDTRRRILGPDHPDTLRSVNNLGMDFLAAHHYDEAEATFRSALEPSRRVLGPQAPDVSNLLYNLGSVEAMRHRRAPALAWLGQAVEAGYDNHDDMGHDPNLEWLHGDPAFTRLVAAVEAKHLK